MTIAAFTGAVGHTPTGYVCACGRKHKFPGYVYAQCVTYNVDHTCECGRKNTVLRGSFRVDLGELPKKGRSDDKRSSTARAGVGTPQGRKPRARRSP